MKLTAILLLLVPLAPLALGQAVPAGKGPAFYTGFHLPDVSGTLRYSLSVSQRLHVGANNTSANYGNTFDVSGNAAYLSTSRTQPFSMIYSGGYLYEETGKIPSQVVQNLALSQVIQHDRWKFIVADTLSYLPESPAFGLSGIAGLGDINVPPVTGTQEILSNYAQRLTNMVSGTVQRDFTASTNLSGTGTQSITRYLDVPTGSNIDNDSYSGSGKLQHEFDARTSASVSYVYNTFNYISIDFGITTQMVALQFQRQLTRRAMVSVSAGPQHISSSNPTVVSSRTNFSGNGSLSYVTRDLTTSLSFSQGATAGSGLIAGVNSTSVHLTASRQLGQAWHVSADVGYLKSSSLQIGAYKAQSVIFGTQANRSILKTLSAFVSYSLQHQINTGTNIPSLALNGLIQYLSFGVTYAPEAINIGH